MRAFLIILTLLSFASTPSHAESFVKLYKVYQAALETGDREAVQAAALDAYEAAKVEYPQSEYHAIAAYNYGIALPPSDDSDVRLLQESADIFESLHGETHESLVDPLWELGKRLVNDLDRQRALICLSRVDKVLSANGIDDPSLLFQLRLDRAGVYAMTGDPQGGLAALREAEELVPRMSAPQDYFRALVSFNRGKYLGSLGRDSAAIEAYERAVAAFEASVPPDHKILLVARGFLVQRLEEAKRGDEATAQLQKIAMARAGGPDLEQIPVYRKQPDYPAGALKWGREGFVKVELAVTPDGRVEDVKALESSHKEFEAPAIEAAKGFRYAPKIENGVPARAEGITYLFTFNISD